MIKNYSRLWNNGKILTAFLLTAVILLSSCSGIKKEKTQQSEEPISSQTDANAEEGVKEIYYTVFTKGYDWGPGNSKIVLSSGQTLKNVPLEEDAFEVEATKTYMGYDFEKNESVKKTDTGKINVTTAYYCDENGEKTLQDSSFIALELEVHPDNILSNPYNYDFSTGHNKDVGIEYTIKQVKDIDADGEKVSGLFFEKTMNKGDIIPEVQKYKKSSYKYTDEQFGDIELQYSYYKPDTNEPAPLIVLFHGAGEGGTDVYVPLLGNKVVALSNEHIQSYFKNAYVLAPQSPDMWMNDGSGNYTTGGTSKYTNAAFNLIKDFIEEQKGIDKSRVYVGGGSNGGYMTVNMVLNAPELFAAAFPICQAYQSEWITDEQISQITDVPMWFIHAEKDPIVPFEPSTKALYERLVAKQAKDVHMTVFDSVKDTSGLYFDSEGSPYAYNDHWSWIYVYNDEVDENGKSLFAWLSEQSK